VSINQTAATSPESVRAALVDYLSTELKTPVTTDQDLLTADLVSSMFAMELAVQLEQTYGIAVVGEDMRMENFRTVDTMVDLVLRLRSAPDQ